MYDKIFVGGVARVPVVIKNAGKRLEMALG